MEIQTTWTSAHDFVWQSNGVVIHTSASVPRMHKTSPNPYELFLFSLAGSTGLEIIKHFRDHHTKFESLAIKVDGKLVAKYETKVFSSINVLIICKTESDPVEVMNAVEYSQYLASGISAMISKFIPISWRLEVNGEVMGDGIPNFQEPNENVYE